MSKRYSWGAAAFALCALAGALIAIVWQFIELNSHRLDAYSAAGEFFNLAYGLPLALGSTLISGLLAFLAARIAQRQGDVEILKFVDDKIQPSVQTYRRLVNAIGELFRIGNAARELGATLLSIIVAEGGPSRSRLHALLRESPKHFTSEEEAQRFISETPKAYHSSLARTYLLLTDMQTQVDALAASFEAVKDDMHASIFARAKFESEDAEQQPLAWLRKQIPAGANLPAAIFASDMPSLLRNLANYAGMTAALELPAATLDVPDDNYTVDYLGYVLHPYTLRPKQLIQYGQLMIAGYRFNIGAAYILSIAQYIPNKETFLNTFEKMFMGRSKIAMNLIDLVIVDERDSISPSMLHTLKPCLDDLNRLIMIDIWTGDRAVSVFYDPVLHGPIPKKGFAEFEDVLSANA